jgi:hypothetical protein
MGKHSKRWLMSRMKTSGSERRYVSNGRYADESHEWKSKDEEVLPFRAGIDVSSKFYNGKINYGLIPRFLRGKIGQDWDEVFSEIIARIPSKLQQHREMIFWYVAKDVEIIDGQLWDKSSQKIIWQEGLIMDFIRRWKGMPDFKSYEFYVDPSDNKLRHIPQKSYRKKMQMS